VIATLQENPIQLQRVARGFGWSLDDERVAVTHRSPNDVYIDEWVYELLELVPELFQVGRLAEYGISHLSDNVVLLQYLRVESRLVRTVTILKSRASAHDPEIREFDITADGIILGDPVTGE
jgi:circadian clock protein KaiC